MNNRDEEYQGQFGSPWQNQGRIPERGHFQGRGGYESERGYEDRNARLDEDRGIGGQHFGQQWGQNMGQGVDESFGRGIDLTSSLSHVPRYLLQQIGPHVGKGPQGYKRSDERIKEDVCDRLTEHPLIDASTIEVRVQNGEVTLTGTVQDRQMKLLIEQVTDTISGVQDVANNVRVQRQMASTGMPSNVTPDRPSQSYVRDQRTTS